MPITATLWDFGGVLSSSPFEAFTRFEHAHGLPAGFLRRVNATDPDTNAWARFERSELDLAGFDAAFAEESAALGHRVQGAEVLELLAGEVRPTMVEAVRRCREAGLRTALLTNNVAAMDGWEHAVPLDDLFDVVVESSKEGVRKPDPAAYELVLERLSVPPTEVVFLDDLGVNLKPAKAMGMTTIKVADPDDALDELERLVGLALR
jgi:putative hydrolase of the HAD superfamily